ncbi:LacI family DNA-binding transcriptional regulator [Peterkaempfera bronchialis]|uniref:LacI family DNA-binding transcriptional regulator n=2 Tax=Peterkaempfera bronchialis TaxID=2126346 RepID=A0A345T4D7_9ACTN|nr:LacI family DNA-binding transcriptional regulator [Peterkaempfera bronchialis]
MTVSNVFNGTGRVSAAVRTRVLETAEALGYAGPDPTAASLRRRRTGTLGVVLPMPLAAAFADPAATAFLRGAAEEFQRRELGMTLLALPPAVGPLPRTAAAPPHPVSPAPLAALERAVIDAALLYSVEVDHPGLAVLAKRGLPVAAADSPGHGTGLRIFGAAWSGFVTVDDRDGGHAAARHLIDLGHRRAVVLVDRLAVQPRHGTATWAEALATSSAILHERLSGYLTAWTDAGLPPGHLTVVECGDNTVAAGREATRPLLAAGSPPTAVLAIGDLLALGACQAAEEAGLTIPGDLSVVGYDDIPAAAAADPPLTTVRQPSVDKGRHAARALLVHPDVLPPGPVGRAPAPPVRLSLPVQLIVRHSTARPRSQPD